METRRDGAARWATVALTHRAGGFVLAALYAAIALFRLRDPRFLHDEGIVTWIYARLLGNAPAATLFFQKAKPVGAVVYAPIAAAGLLPFLVAHVLVAALAMPLLASVARALHLRWPNVPALILASSPLYMVAGPTGLSNGDANVALIAALYLLVVKRRELAAGVLLGAIPWIRFELGLLVAVVVLHETIFARRRRLLLGAAIFPVAYALAGAVYHRELLWMLRFPPAAPVMEGIEVFDSLRKNFDIGVLAKNWLELTPLIGLAILPWGPRRHSVERALGLFTVVYLAAITIAPFFAIANFDLSPRYAMQALPPLALIVARRLEAPSRPSFAMRALGIAVLLGLWAFAHAVRARAFGGDHLGGITLIVVAAYAAIVALLWAGRPRTAAFALVALSVAGPLMVRREMAESGYAPSQELDEMAAMLERHRHEGVTVYTNAHLLPTYLERTGRLRGVPVLFLLGADQRHELVALSNETNGQRDRLLAGIHRAFFGPVADPATLAARVPEGALFLLVEDHRTKLMLHGAIAPARHVELERTPRVRLTSVEAR